VPASFEIVPATTLFASALGALYTSPLATSTRIEKLTFFNTDTAAHVVTVMLVPSAQAVGLGNTILYQQPVAAKGTVDDTNTPGHYLSAGDALEAFADTAGVVVLFAAGTQIT
jgi:hypothetical protein